MSGKSDLLRLLVLTEDGSRSGVALEHLVMHLLRRAWPHHAGQVRLQFLPPNPVARARMRANRWKERGQDQINFIQTLATDLAKGDVFVIVHLDGDRPWAHRGRQDPASNRAHFERQILPRVRSLLEGRGAGHHLGRLLLVEPFYSIEAWLYLNDAQLRAWYARHAPPGHVDLELLDTWRDSPELLDELEKPKEALIVRDRHNGDLASTGFPAAKAEKLGKSFAAAVRAFRACEPLRSQLDRGEEAGP